MPTRQRNAAETKIELEEYLALAKSILSREDYDKRLIHLKAAYQSYLEEWKRGADEMLVESPFDTETCAPPYRKQIERSSVQSRSMIFYFLCKELMKCNGDDDESTEEYRRASLVLEGSDKTDPQLNKIMARYAKEHLATAFGLRI